MTFSDKVYGVSPKVEDTKSLPVENDEYELTEYGKACSLRMLVFWEKHGFTNFVRFQKIIAKYRKLEYAKGWVHARRAILNLHGISIFDLSRVYPEYFIETPEEILLKRKYDEEVKRKSNERMFGAMFSPEVLSEYYSFDQLRMASQLFNSMYLMPVAKFFEGYYAIHDSLFMLFHDDYLVAVGIESFKGDDLARELKCEWKITRHDETIRSGSFVDQSYRNTVEIANKALEEALATVYVGGEKVAAGSKWLLTENEAEFIYLIICGPFILADDEEKSMFVFERKDGRLDLISEK